MKLSALLSVKMSRGPWTHLLLKHILTVTFTSAKKSSLFSALSTVNKHKNPQKFFVSASNEKLLKSKQTIITKLRRATRKQKISNFLQLFKNYTDYLASFKISKENFLNLISTLIGIFASASFSQNESATLRTLLIYWSRTENRPKYAILPGKHSNFHLINDFRTLAMPIRG